MEINRRCKLGLISLAMISYLLLVVCFNLYQTKKEQEGIIANQEESIAILMGVKMSPEDEALLAEANRLYKERGYSK